MKMKMKSMQENKIIITITTTLLLSGISGVTSFCPKVPHHAIQRAERYRRGTPLVRSCDIPRSNIISASNNDISEEDSVDRAPCFDSICDSDVAPDTASATTAPSPSSSLSTSSPASPGTATQRLGINSNPTVWSEFGRIASAHPHTANLGQGFPDWLPPKFCVDALVESVTDVSQRSPHQYTRTAGHGSLVSRLAERYSVHLERRVDPMAEVAVTVGASQALFVSLQTLVQPGDEVILFEPFFDLYVNQIKLAGGTPVYVPLTFQPYTTDDSSISGGEWVLEPEKLREKITPRTRAIILNSPHNPTGKIFSKTEMEAIADAVLTVADERCIVISDEVYKYIVHSKPKDDGFSQQQQQQQPNGSGNIDFPGPEEPHQPPSSSVIPCKGHVHFASLPSMFSRTITISSAGKTFSATGWQVGWAVGPSNLIQPIHQLLPYVQFCASTVVQEALARALPRADSPYRGFGSYYEYLVAMYTKKRDVLAAALTKAGFAVPDYDRTSGGGFFIFARITPKVRDAVPPERLHVANSAVPGGISRLDWALCQWMAEEKGVLCIPATPFFSEERVKNGDAEGFVRVAFCKTDETLEAAAEALEKLLVVDGEDGNDGELDGETLSILEVEMEETAAQVV